MKPEDVRAWRGRVRMTQREAAAWWGCTERTWQRYEAGDRRIPTPLIHAIERTRVAKPQRRR